MSICLRVILHTKKYTDGTHSVVLECYQSLKGNNTLKRLIICKVKPDQFDQETKRVINHPNESLLNALISKLHHDAETRLYTLKLHQKPVTVAAILDFETPLPHQQAMLLASGRRYVERCRLKGQLHTAEKYGGHLAKLSEYLGKNPDGSRKDVHLDDVTEEWILQWVTWLRNNGTKSAITLHRRMGFISTLFIDARKRGLTKVDPMAFLVFKEPKVHKSKLTHAQLLEVEKASLAAGYRGRLLDARNTFMLQFYAHGSRISDALTWKKENIVRRHDGVYLVYTTRKTEAPMSIRLNPRAVALVEHYLATTSGPFLLPWLSRFRDKPYLTSQQNEQRLLDQISSKTAMVNANLKEIEAILGLGVKLTTHVARHSFASLADRLLSDTRIVSAALGHTNFATTEVYLADLNSDQINEAMNKFWKKGKWL
jgi:integrase